MARLYNNIKFERKLSFKERCVELVKPQPIRLGNPWYIEIQPTAFYREEDLERSVLLNLQSLFPDFLAVPYKKKIKNKKNNRINAPDLALVKKDYSEWYVIEVELSSHNIAHVELQIDTFYNCTYGLDDVKYLFDKNKDKFKYEPLEKLITSKPPKLMVIINDFDQNLKDKIAIFNCSICVFQIFLDKDNHPFYRLDGEYPLTNDGFCFCFLEKNIPYTVKLLGDNKFLDSHNLKHGQEIQIAFNGILSIWEFDMSSSVAYLICNSRNFPLEPSTSRYMLSFNKTSNLFTFSKA